MENTPVRANVHTGDRPLADPYLCSALESASLWTNKDVLKVKLNIVIYARHSPGASALAGSLDRLDPVSGQHREALIVRGLYMLYRHNNCIINVVLSD